MPIEYGIITDQKLAYIRAWGKVSAEDIMMKGAAMFSEKSWKNGYHIICDYRDIEDLHADMEDVQRIVNQDKDNEAIFDRSRLALVATEDLVYGVSRMWELLSQDNRQEKMIFRNMEDAIEWLGLESHVLQIIQGHAGPAIKGGRSDMDFFRE